MTIKLNGTVSRTSDEEMDMNSTARALTASEARRVSMQHRMVYRILDDAIVIHSFHGHYVTDL